MSLLNNRDSKCKIIQTAIHALLHLQKGCKLTFNTTNSTHNGSIMTFNALQTAADILHARQKVRMIYDRTSTIT
jgi:hypothetical protein